VPRTQAYSEPPWSPAAPSPAIRIRPASWSPVSGC